MTDVIDHANDDALVELLGRTMRAVADVAPDLPIDDQNDRHRWVAVAVAVAVVGVAGAGLALRSASEPRPLPPLDPNDPRPTVQSFGPTRAEDRMLYDAEDRMLRDCMATAGQIWRLSAFDRFGGDLDPVWELIGRTDLERAETMGYNTSPQIAFDDDVSNGDESAPAWEMAFYGGAGDNLPTVTINDPVTGGDPSSGPTVLYSGGCWGAAQSLLYGDQARYTSLSIYISNELSQNQWSGPLRDPRIDGPIRAWSDCMVEHGHRRYSLPTDPGNETARHQTDPNQYWQPTPDEITLAVDDVRCKESSALTDTAQQLLDAYGRAAAATALPLLEEYGEIVDRAIDQATTYLRGTLDAPWRADPSAASPQNTSACVWLPNDPSTLDMSAGERFELVEYVNAIESFEDPLPDAADVAVPPWLLAESTCVNEATSQLVDSIRASISPS